MSYRSLNGNSGNILNNVLFKGMNLADLNDVATARANLGLIGSLSVNANPYLTLSGSFNGLTNQSLSLATSTNATPDTLVAYSAYGCITASTITSPGTSGNISFLNNDLNNVNNVNCATIYSNLGVFAYITPFFTGSSTQFKNYTQTQANVIIYDNGNVDAFQGTFATKTLTANTKIQSDLFQPYTTNANIMFKNSAGTEIMRIQNNGNVGIGSTNPAVALDVGIGGISCANFKANTYQPSTANGSMYFKNTAGAFNMTILDNGNVGIGSVTPTVALDVGSGDINCRNINATNYLIASYLISSPRYRPLNSGDSIVFQNWGATQISSIDNSGNLQTNGYVRAGNGTSAGIVDLWDLNSYKWRISTSGGFFTVLNDSTGTADTTGTGNPTNNKFFCDKNGLLTTVGGVKTNSINVYTGSTINFNNVNLINIANITKQLWSYNTSATTSTYNGFANTNLPTAGTPSITYTCNSSTSLYTIRVSTPFLYQNETSVRITYYLSSVSSGTLTLLLRISYSDGTWIGYQLPATYTSTSSSTTLYNQTISLSGLTAGTSYIVSFADNSSVASSTYTLRNPEISLLY